MDKEVSTWIKKFLHGKRSFSLDKEISPMDKNVSPFEKILPIKKLILQWRRCFFNGEDISP